MVLSPYSPGAGVTPPVLAGRDAELTAAQALLGRTAAFGRPAPAPLILTGSRGVGKTVILRAMAANAREVRFIAVELSADGASSLPHRLAERIAEALRPDSTRTAKWEAWRDRLRSFSIEVSIAGVVKVGGSVQAEAASSVGRDALVDLLDRTAGLAKERGYAGLALFLDELQEAPRQQLVVITNTFQDALGGSSSPLVVVGADLPALPDRLMEAGSFAERFDYRLLRRLSDAAASHALLEPAHAVGVHWSSAAAGHVLAEANGFPYLLQLFGDASWNSAQPERGVAIGRPDAERGVTCALQRLDEGMFRGRWNKATPQERKLFEAVARVCDEEGVASTGEVAQHMGKQTKALSMSRAGLIDKGLLEAPSRGTLSFTMPGFERFVLDQAQGDADRS